VRAGHEQHGIADLAVIHRTRIHHTRIDDTGIDDTSVTDDQPEFWQLGFVHDARESITIRAQTGSGLGESPSRYWRR
jgi:hypothetical protein